MLLMNVPDGGRWREILLQPDGTDRRMDGRPR
jgi:hypothetical protein